MKAVIQRVLSGAVTSEGEVVGSIQKGMVVLVGMARDDTAEDMEYIHRKIVGVRLWSNADGTKMWCRNVREIDGSVLLVSQFTLMHVMKGNKPDFHHAMPSEEALVMCNTLRDKLRADLGAERVATGKFQHYMNVQLVNDGPVTLVLDSRNKG
ncbi:putative D-tyrosyl-tRNA deacylase [Leptomonas pyrrhocoris]|uniref:D-aminoacyl-tRNA deacylase n=1 Tax=Leptomonas pyrrhocoris TaxID=157538 RepID=A0A0M9G323_LEPPY|nr:putative D-tyrosyl-tRNA deacylase [Leptomonas pyrrhocoris]KPA81233.1 putative D-tyrosyl-tRNA deacylase [Leptomonas pyrrhocoris]|eukprot:XP_015659672.1 putative D-tyrosyl-tRNA deacylase [Leptomonas pyrrhocoris]